jgi:UDP-N-acetylglucosamine--N-acetylmuramyl-(pentapeptide) pyrophosphoryl-undecaprenol N-acetylglucosamine transferase
VVIAAGGTAGHVKPALAIADALRADGAEVTFVGTGRGSAAGLVAAAGLEEDVIPMRGLERRLTPANLIALGLAAAAVPRAVRVLRRRRADAVIGGGGYVAGPVAVAAWLLRIPVLLTEADSQLGMANRLAAPLARKVALAFPVAGRTPPKYVVTGRPIGRDVRAATREAGRAALGIAPDATCVLVAGGSQGAQRINRAVAEAYGGGPPFDLIHIAGARQVDDTREVIGDRDPGPRYRLRGYMDGFHDAVAAADLVVSRAGGSVFELAAIGRPAILIPYPYATADHQTKNARWLIDAGAAVLLPDAECTADRLGALIDELLGDRSRLERMAAAARTVARPDAAERIARAVAELAPA